MTTAELRKAEARYQRASRRAEELRLERNALILEALGAGWTHAQIAEATGLTRGRIGQLAKQSARFPVQPSRASTITRAPGTVST